MGYGPLYEVPLSLRARDGGPPARVPPVRRRHRLGARDRAHRAGATAGPADHQVSDRSKISGEGAARAQRARLRLSVSRIIFFDVSDVCGLLYTSMSALRAA